MIQRLLDIFYRDAKSKLKLYNRFGGYFNYKKMLLSQQHMEKFSENLAPILSDEMGLPVYFLTGKKYLYQTLFCIYSLRKCSTQKFHFVLVDDGSFDKALIDRVRRQIPGSRIILADEIAMNIEAKIPMEKYSYLHKKRHEYPHIKKLTDIHTSSQHEWKIVIDSDMLFWSEPKEFIEWINQPKQPIFMLDCEESYGYSRALMSELTGAKLYDLLNVGVIGLRSSTIDWDKLEMWSKVLEEREGTSYYLEQALSAMLIGDQPSTTLSRASYIVNPSKEQVEDGEGCLHHYVDLSKEHYFKVAWKRVAGV
ncbi:hypothetical protein [Desertivirga arenae]|uniref:hypothetical protein n=1 Tax=Desertivirga arenae TaxID=2810309 RepID=UPI001A96DB60|nr:hypothetical protein [Pedobacter sp. SYSU D00823]